MLFKRLKQNFRSIGFRLTTWNTAIILLCVAGTLLGLRIGLYRALLDETDNGLLDDLIEAERILNDQQFNSKVVQTELERKAQSRVHHAWFVQFRGLDGKERWATSGRPVEITDALPTDPPAKPTTVAGYRLTEQMLESPIAGVGSIRVGVSLQSIDQQVARTDWIAFPIALTVLAVAPALGLWLSQRATRPLREMIDSISRIRERDLDERLRVRGSGDEIDHLSIKINDLLDRLSTHLRNNRDFVTNAAHEIRSPLAAIHGSVEYALAHRRSEEEYKELLGDMMDRTHALTTMVNQLLFLAEAENDRLKSAHESTDLLHLAQKSVDMFEALAESKSVQLLLVREERVFVRVDFRHMNQVIMNLIDNAIKFTDVGGRVELEVYHDAEQGRGVLVVRDSGMGISTEELPHVFERFYRGKFARHRRSGTGLGLSICKSIVTASGGTIVVKSKIGEGTEFRVSLAEGPHSSQTHQAPIPARSASANG